MEPTMYGRLAIAMTATVSRRHGTPDGDDGDNEPLWSLELASSWARLDAACGSHALAESEPLITTTLAMLPPQSPTVARARCVAEARSNNEPIARSLDGLLLWLVHLSPFAADIFPKSYKASSVTSSLSTMTKFSASRSVVSLAYPHLASSPLYAPPLLVRLAISRFKLCGMRSRRRVLTCQITRETLLLLTIWLYAAEVLRSTPLTFG
jgi:hypothetical protein